MQIGTYIHFVLLHLPVLRHQLRKHSTANGPTGKRDTKTRPTAGFTPPPAPARPLRDSQTPVAPGRQPGRNSCRPGEKRVTSPVNHQGPRLRLSGQKVDGALWPELRRVAQTLPSQERSGERSTLRCAATQLHPVTELSRARCITLDGASVTERHRPALDQRWNATSPVACTVPVARGEVRPSRRALHQATHGRSSTEDLGELAE